jgi:hypothetical protein
LKEEALAHWGLSDQKQKTNTQTNKQTNKHTNKQTNKQTKNKNTNKHTNKQTHKQTNTVARKMFNATFSFDIYINWVLYGGENN